MNAKWWAENGDFSEGFPTFFSSPPASEIVFADRFVGEGPVSLSATKLC